MGNHRGQRRAEPRRRSTSEAPTAPPRQRRSDKPEKYVGRRVAGRAAPAPSPAATPAPAVDALGVDALAASTADRPLSPEQILDRALRSSARSAPSVEQTAPEAPGAAAARVETPAAPVAGRRRAVLPDERDAAPSSATPTATTALTARTAPGGRRRADRPATEPATRAGRIAPEVAADDAPHGRAAELLTEPVAQNARAEESAQLGPTLATQQPLFAVPTPTVELPSLAELTGELPAITDSTTTLRPAAPGKRRAAKGSGGRGPLFRGVPTLPVAVGVATLAVAIGGAVTTAEPQLVSTETPLAATNALSGSFGTGTFDAMRSASKVSRDSDRDALARASDAELVDQAEKVAEQRDAALGELAADAEKKAQQIAALDRWVLPISSSSYRLTARYGEYGLWSSYHTGLDFAAPTGTPIMAVTKGVITSAGYDGAYGNKTVLTLEDGTEVWYCHQTAFNASVGQTVEPGQVIGYVGSTGHVTGPHLHLEVRPGGGDPVDPDAALRVQGIAP
ncbi:hypothetical protein E8D34_11330 [Nocardioides sp. GY 10113]|uniref:M23 family metallopeptidase n=1 Tax=Nocardioides sp. GY 10113 TaxID=2569761 RepID=UPI0010A7AEC8|nr:M23 family metallopeptidase [Nocardioides sp. GY 10113]TIC86265.1 hypothetical protein E8D34_11330 [Nocardioides sp. GY 10113]